MRNAVNLCQKTEHPSAKDRGEQFGPAAELGVVLLERHYRKRHHYTEQRYGYLVDPEFFELF